LFKKKKVPELVNEAWFSFLSANLKQRRYMFSVASVFVFPVDYVHFVLNEKDCWHVELKTNS
jgi:hypothetical protein